MLCLRRPKWAQGASIELPHHTIKSKQAAAEEEAGGGGGGATPAGRWAQAVESELCVTLVLPYM